MKRRHIDFVVNNIREGMFETAREDLMFKLDGYKLPLRVIRFYTAPRFKEGLTNY